MPRLSRKVHLIQEVMDSPFSEEKNKEYTKYSNANFEILKQKSFFLVIDKRNNHTMKMYPSLEAAHKHIKNRS